MLADLQPPGSLALLGHESRWRLITALAGSDRQVHELVDSVGQPANLVSYHLGKLRNSGLVREQRSSADGRDIYYSLDLERLQSLLLAAGEALHPGLFRGDLEEHLQVLPPTRVLFLCTENSARSQLAEGILRALGGSIVAVESAGSRPSTMHPEALRILREFGADVRRHRAKHFDVFGDQDFDYIITVCDRIREECPVLPGDPERIHWSFIDPASVPAEQISEAFDVTYRQLTTRIRFLLNLINRRRQELRALVSWQDSAR